jgi:mxaJ protein
MYSRFSALVTSRDIRRLPVAAGLLALCLLVAECSRGEAAPHKLTTLRVCSDPNNLPYSNRALEGFENRIAELVASDLGLQLTYSWWPQRRGFVRNTLNAGSCDVIMGMPTSFELAMPTAPYYRSTYVFLTRRDRDIQISSLDDSSLRELRIGLHIIGDDYSNSPAAEALAKRGIIRNVVGYSIYGDYSKPNPPAALVIAVEKDDVDVAVIWGPTAGYFARRSPVPLRLTPVTPAVDLPFTPFVFDISAGVRRQDTLLRARMDTVLRRRHGDITRILESYGVPLVAAGR